MFHGSTDSSTSTSSDAEFDCIGIESPHGSKLPSIGELPLSESTLSLFNSINNSPFNLQMVVNSSSMGNKASLRQQRPQGSLNTQICQTTTDSKAHQKCSSWSAQEDEVLLNIVSGKNTPINWDYVSSIDGRHTPKQCRERWLVKLNPDVRRSPFAPWEDELIQNERQKIGNHWSLIAQLLPGRTSCSVKNRWYTVLRYKPQTVQIPVFSSYGMAAVQTLRQMYC